MHDEGYIKFSLTMRADLVPEHPELALLNNARQQLYAMGLVGAYANGVGFGNLSLRAEGEQFIITGSGTGSKKQLSAADYALVEEFDSERNAVVASGMVKASSESMTHGALYRADGRIGAVIHIHSRSLFDALRSDGAPQTPATAAFGTPALARAIAVLVKDSSAPSGFFVTAGHDEGVVAYGTTVGEALEIICRLMARYI